MIVCMFFKRQSLVLESRLLQFFGSISYEFYLIHFVTLLSLRPLDLSAWKYITISFIIAIGISVMLNSMLGIMKKTKKTNKKS